MTIRFAMARSRRRFPYLPWKRATVALCAANDNRADTAATPFPTTALRHFARHGLAAPEEAHREAVRAMDAQDEPTFRKWLEICRTFDRRMAANLTRKAARRTGPEE